MFDAFGPQYWWPGDTRLEICIGAILTQNTNWKNAAKAIENLKKEGMLDLYAIAGSDEKKLAEMIRSSGYYNQKTKKLKAFAKFVIEEEESFEGFDSYDTVKLRELLLSIRGIGPETADDMLLYAFDRPVFVVDAYTFRIFHRHGLLDDSASYNEIAELFASNLESDSKLYGEYHALIVQIGKNFCKKSKPKCESCPLFGDLKKISGQ
ncbi:MAG: endonuclease III domain-containing protein [Candidatus Zixiibacteriota bacterium]